MKGLVFCGAFNPPTIAHIEMAKYALEKTHADYVLFVPSKSKYIQQDQSKDFAFREEERLDFLQAIAKSRSWMRVSDLELKAEDQPRTYLTLTALKKETKDELKLLIGSDKLAELEQSWRYVDEIGKEFGFVVMSRNHDSLSSLMESPYLKERKSYFLLLPAKDDYQNISSTSVRTKIRHHETIHGLVPEEIEALLKEKTR